MLTTTPVATPADHLHSFLAHNYLYWDDMYGIQALDSKVHGANMGPIWGRQVPGGPHVGPMNLAIWGLMRIGTCNMMEKS